MIVISFLIIIKYVNKYKEADKDKNLINDV